MIALTLVNFCMFWDMVFFSKQGLWECVFFAHVFLLRHHFSCHKSNLLMYVYIYILLSSLATSLNTIDFSNPVCTLLFCFQIQTAKKQPTKPIFQPIMELHWLVFFCRFVCFGFGFQSRRAKCRPHWTTLCVVPMCLKFLPDISSMNYLANKNQLYHGGGPTSTQPHLWISSKCACSVDFFMVWVPWQTGIENHGRKMHHSHDLNISTSLSASTLFVFFVGFARPGRLHFIPQKGRANPTKKC